MLSIGAHNRNGQAERKFDGEKEAHLIALTCGEKPEGEGQWSLRLLTERFVLAQIIVQIPL